MIRVNGQMLEGYENSKLADLLNALQFDCTKIAVERNGEIIPKKKYQETVLTENDVIEVVSFVGGG